jgi:hypothetical protein
MANGFLEVQRKMCATCIYRATHRGTQRSIVALEAEIADPYMPGRFAGFRVCHHSPRRRRLVCAGFWHRHRDKFALGQIAQRLKFVKYVSIDRFAKKEKVCPTQPVNTAL